MQNLTVHFNHKPLRLSKSLVTDESVPGRQTFDAAAGGHIPDYTLTPLILQPLVGLTDPDGIIHSGTANSQLADIQWEWFAHDRANGGGTWRVIDTTNPNFSLVTANAPYGTPTNDGIAGRIYVRKNADPGYPLMLRFSAKFIDPRTLQASPVSMEYTVVCDNATSPEATVTLDGKGTFYNPLRDPDLQTITASVNTPDGVPAPGSYMLMWDIMWDGAWECLNPSDPSKTVNPLLYFAAVSPDGQSLTIDRSLMPEFLPVRCRLRHSYVAVPGNPDFDALAPDREGVPTAVCAIRRVLPALDPEGLLATSIPSDTTRMLAQGCVRLRNGAVVKNAPGTLRPIWRVGTNTASGSGVAMKVVSTEMSTLLDTSDMHRSYGMRVSFDAEDAGPLIPLTDSDGAIITDENGGIILFH